MFRHLKHMLGGWKKETDEKLSREQALYLLENKYCGIKGVIKTDDKSFRPVESVKKPLEKMMACEFSRIFEEVRESLRHDVRYAVYAKGIERRHYLDWTIRWGNNKLWKKISIKFSLCSD